MAFWGALYIAAQKAFFGASCVVNTMLYFTIALLLFRVPCEPIVVYNSGSEVPTHSVSGPICPKLTALHASPFSSCCFSLSSASLCVATLKAFVNWKIRLGWIDKKTIYWLIDWLIVLLLLLLSFAHFKTLSVWTPQRKGIEKKKASESLQIFHHNSWWPSSEIVQGLIYTVFF